LGKEQQKIVSINQRNLSRNYTWSYWKSTQKLLLSCWQSFADGSPEEYLRNLGEHTVTCKRSKHSSDFWNTNRPLPSSHNLAPAYFINWFFFIRVT
jgi:hypothetical protein